MTTTLRIEPPGGAQSERPCADGPLVFGRANTADVVCADPSMSRQHARIVPAADGCYLEDLGARNGTFLNGERVSGRVRLNDGDVITMGGTIVRVSFRTAGTSPTSSPPEIIGSGLLGSSIFRSISEIVPDDLSAVDVHGTTGRIAARLKAINEFHRALAGAVSLDALLQLLLDRLFAVLHPEEGIILLRRADGSVTPAASRRLPGATGDLLISQRLIEEVVEKGTAALVTDVALDDRFAAAQSVLGAGVRSILAAPFTDNEGCVGMIAVYSRTTVRRFGEDDLELLVSLASAAALRIRNVELSEAAAARKVQDRELALAHDIQMSMLPRQMVSRSEIDMAATVIPARAVGGDLYDFLILGDALWFVVADAAGKGVSAALYMAVTRTLFRAVAGPDASVVSVVERMNAELARDNEQQFFVTALVGRLDLRGGTMAWCSAGHPAMLHARGSAVAPLATPPGIALGVMEDAPYMEAQTALAPGDSVLLFSDGVTEAVNPAAELFSDERLLRAFRPGVGDDASLIVAGVVRAVNAFAAGAAQEDDITVLAIRYLG